MMMAFANAIPLSNSAVTLTNAGQQQQHVTSQRRQSISTSKSVITMGPWKKGEKDEAFQKQQEILARRRNKKENSDHFKEVQKRREAIEAYYDKKRLKVPVGEDPIIAWKKLKEDGLIDESTYTEFDEGGIPIPMASFGIPQYDNGGRFDLRLPHVEIGYTDPESDVMAKAGKAFKTLFGFGGKDKKENKNEDDAQDIKSDANGKPQ